MVPGAGDDVQILVMTGEPVTVPSGYDASAMRLVTYSPLAVDGSLSLR